MQSFQLDAEEVDLAMCSSNQCNTIIIPSDLATLLQAECCMGKRRWTLTVTIQPAKAYEEKPVMMRQA